jgi:hypothetical protein
MRETIMPIADDEAYDALDLDETDRAELEVIKTARERQMAAARVKLKALGEAPPGAPGEQPESQEPPPQTPGEIARASRKLTSSEVDDQRRKDSEAHIAAVKAGQVPHDPKQPVHVTTAPVPGSAQALAQLDGLDFDVWRATPVAVHDSLTEEGQAPKYSPDWKGLKDQLKFMDGDWIADHFRFPARVENVIGFFIGVEDKDQEVAFPFPHDTKVESFEVIVKGNKIFRSEIED